MNYLQRKYVSFMSGYYVRKSVTLKTMQNLGLFCHDNLIVLRSAVLVHYWRVMDK